MLWRKKKIKAKKPVQDQNDFADNYKLFKYIGMIRDGSFYSTVRAPTSIFLLFFAWFHHLVPLVMNYDEYSFDELMDLIILELVYFLWCIVWPSFLIKSSVVASMTAKIKTGLHPYTDSLTMEEKTILSTANDAVVRITKIGFYVYLGGGIGIFLKGINRDRVRKLSLPNIGWFPFAINSLSRYAFGCLCQAIMGVNAVSIAVGTFMSFAMFMIHYEAQFKVLRTHLKRTFPRNIPLEITQKEEYKKVTMRRLKDCYLHHLGILEFHNEMLEYFGILLLSFRIAIVLWLCTLVYVAVVVDVTANSLLKLMSFASTELLFVFLFSTRGQDATDWNDAWREQLYSIEWWQQPKDVRTNILLMLLGTIKPITIYGVWKIAVYSHEGLLAIGNESFSFFNMLRAMH